MTGEDKSSTVMAITLPVVGIGDEFGITIGYPKQGETLPYLQAQVGGYVDAIEIVLPETGTVATLWIADEGKINGERRNVLAEMVAQHGGWRGREHGDWIAGPCVVTGHDPETGETVTLPDDWAMDLGLIITTYKDVLALATLNAQAAAASADQN